MSLRRAMHDSSTEMTDSKRRLTDPNIMWTDPNELWTDPNELWTDSNELTSFIDRLYTFCEELPSPIFSLFSDHLIDKMAAVILKNYETGGFFEMALELLKFVEDTPRISGDDFSLLVCKVWLNPKFLHGLRAVIEKSPDLISLVMCYANQDSPTDRMAQMEADPCFKPCLLGMKSATRNTIIRVFLGILIGYWSDQRQLTELDKRMGKNFFGRRMDMIALGVARAEKKDNIEELSFDIKDISDMKEMEPLRKLLVSKYGGGAIDVEDIFEKAKADISFFLDINQKHLGYSGKKAKIVFSVINGQYGEVYSIT